MAVKLKSVFSFSPLPLPWRLLMMNDFANYIQRVNAKMMQVNSHAQTLRRRVSQSTRDAIHQGHWPLYALMMLWRFSQARTPAEQKVCVCAGTGVIFILNMHTQYFDSLAASGLLGTRVRYQSVVIILVIKIKPRWWSQQRKNIKERDSARFILATVGETIWIIYICNLTRFLIC